MKPGTMHISSSESGPNTRFDATQLQWLGSMNNEVSSFFLADTSPVQTLDEVFAGKPFVVGSAGTSSDLHIFAIVVNAIFGARCRSFRVIRGRMKFC
jgi:tripartite-type tricarboxylate transporter receptor subunit TctC